MFTPNEQAFVDAHPEIAKDYPDGLDWLNKYTDYKDGRINEQWERNKAGVLVNVTERVKAREEIERAKEEIERLGGKCDV